MHFLFLAVFCTFARASHEKDVSNVAKAWEGLLNINKQNIQKVNSMCLITYDVNFFIFLYHFLYTIFISLM